MLRIILFLLTNLSVMLIFGIILNLTGLKYNSHLNLIIIAGLFGFLGSIVSLFFSKWIALKSVNGKIIRYPSNQHENWLFNIISKQSKIVGIKIPEIAIYNAKNINAFATGYNRNNSLIAISSGLLQQMTKDEAEAVIGHEISHISNGDMVTMTLLQGIMNTFVIFLSKTIAKIITNVFYINKNENLNNNLNTLIYSVSSIISELIFNTLSIIIIMWFSRTREFHADAGSAKLVGKKKMINALKKLQVSSCSEEPNNVITFCINGRFSSILNLFMSHPSLKDRIHALHQNYYF